MHTGRKDRAGNPGLMLIYERSIRLDEATSRPGSSETQAFDDRIFEPYGVRKTGWISLSGCQPNRVQLTAKPGFDYTTLACLRSAISAALKPNSASTSAVCSRIPAAARPSCSAFA